MSLITLKNSKEFAKVYKGRKGHSSFLACFYLPSDVLKFGFVVSKKVGNAVVRNRIKRRFRAIARELNLENGNFIFMAKPEIVNFSYKDTKLEIIKLLRKIDKDSSIFN